MNRGSSTERRCGATMIELVATLVVLAVLAAFALPAARNTGANVAAEAAILRGHLRYAQGMAMANNTYTWSVNLGANSYTLQRNGAPAPINLPNENAPTHTLRAGVSIGAGLGVITFTEWGDIGAARVITVTDGDVAQSISIAATTGLIQ